MPASFSTILDTFDSNSISALWSVGGYVTPTFTSQQLQLTIAASSTSITGMQSIANYDLTGTACSIQVVDAGPQSFTGWTVVPLFILLDFSNELYFQIVNGLLVCYTTIAGVTVAHNTVTYSATSHQFLRIREQSGTIYWDASADGKTWNNLTSLLNPFAITALYMSFLAETGSSNTSDMTAKLDNFNVIQSVSSETISQLDSESLTILSNLSVSDTDAIVGLEASGGTRSIVVSRNPTDVGISGIVDIVYPEFPEFTFGIASGALLSVSVSSVDSCSGTDAIAVRAFGDTDSSVGTDVGAHGTNIFSADSSLGTDTIVGRVLTVTDSITGADSSASIVVTGFFDTDSSSSTDLGTQSFALTHSDSFVGSDAENVTIGTTFTSADSSHLSEIQSITVTVSATETSALTDVTGNRTMLAMETSAMTEATGRNIAVVESSVGSDVGFVAITSSDNCIMSSQQTVLPAIVGVDSSTMADTNNKLSITTINDWVVGLDIIGARKLTGFDNCQTSEALGNRTLQSTDTSVASDAGIHGNFVFNLDSIHMSETNSPPVYSPATTDSMRGTDVASVANGISSTDSIHLTDNQSFTVTALDSLVMTDFGQTTQVAISNTELISGTDAVASRVFAAYEAITLTDSGAPIVRIVATDHIQESNTPVLFVPITQNDRTQGTDNALPAHVSFSITEVITGSQTQSIVYKPGSTDVISISENTSLVETPPDFNKTITVTDSGKGNDVADFSLTIPNNQLSVMSATQSIFARSSTTDHGTFQAEQQSITTHVPMSDFVAISELALVTRMNNTADSVHGTDNQVSGPVDRETTAMTDNESIVEYVALDMSVWAYGVVSMSS